MNTACSNKNFIKFSAAAFYKIKIKLEFLECDNCYIILLDSLQNTFSLCEGAIILPVCLYLKAGYV